MDRRDFLRLGVATTAGALVGSSLWSDALAACAPAQAGPGPYGPLLGPDANGIMLPDGFSSRVIARAFETVPGTGHEWHIFPDGGAVFRKRRDWIYVSNSEFVGPLSCSAIHFDRSGNVVDAYPILEGTRTNCAGGATPWGTWLSCEEHNEGHVWECDPTGQTPGVMRPALGTFKHEAAAVDPHRRVLYLTEDKSDGCFYRFRPHRWKDLSAGTLEVAVVGPQSKVSWIIVPAPNDISMPTRYQVAQATPFAGGEGIVHFRHHVYFTTKRDNRVWDYDVRARTISVLYEAGLDPVEQLTGVDNIAASRGGDLIVAEDGGNMELVMISPDRVASPILRIVGQGGSELTGPAFDPRGERLYVSSQRGDTFGITYEITGPFRRRTPRRSRC